MIVAVWIIAIVEVVRAFQNVYQMWILHSDAAAKKNLYREFIDNLKQDDQEFVRKMLVEFEKQNNDKEYW